MSYLLDDASSHRLTRAVLNAFSMSIWFYPDDAALDCTIYGEYNATGTRYMKIAIRGSTDDKVILQTANAGATPPLPTVSTGTVNYNAWNHVFAARGASSPTHGYISLNGETLVDGGAGSYFSPGTVTVSALGRLGTGEHFSGRIAEAGFWDNCLSDFDDRYKALALAFDPRLIAVEPAGILGLGSLNLISDSPLVGLPQDIVTGTNWTVTGATVDPDHPRMHRQLLG